MVVCQIAVQPPPNIAGVSFSHYFLYLLCQLSVYNWECGLSMEQIWVIGVHSQYYIVTVNELSGGSLSTG